MTLMIAMMAGGALFRVAYNYFQSSFIVSKITSILCIISFSLIVFGNTYAEYYIGYIIFEISCGAFYPTFSKIKSEHLPQKNRGTLMNIFKIPFNLVNIVLLLTTNNIFTIDEFWKINLIVSIISLILQFIFFTKANQVIKTKEE